LTVVRSKKKTKTARVGGKDIFHGRAKNFQQKTFPPWGGRKKTAKNHPRWRNQKKEVRDGARGSQIDLELQRE